MAKGIVTMASYITPGLLHPVILADIPGVHIQHPSLVPATNQTSNQGHPSVLLVNVHVAPKH